MRPRLAGLTDAEYLWQPVDGCWSVRPGVDGRWQVDLGWPEPAPPPVTTIAWRLLHMHHGGEIGVLRDLYRAGLGQ